VTTGGQYGIRRVAGRSLALLTLSSSLGAAVQQAVVPVGEVTALKARYPVVRFSLLSSFEVPEADLPLPRSPHAVASRAETVTLPAEVRRLDGQAVSIRGYMLPLAMEGDQVTDFLLTSSIDSCHFGTIGGMNEWIVVKMAGGQTVPFPKAVPITVFGRLSVGVERQAGLMSSLYRLAADVIAIH
jgi:hypothetical protein